MYDISFFKKQLTDSYNHFIIPFYLNEIKKFSHKQLLIPKYTNNNDSNLNNVKKVRKDLNDWYIEEAYYDQYLWKKIIEGFNFLEPLILNPYSTFTMVDGKEIFITSLTINNPHFTHYTSSLSQKIKNWHFKNTFSIDISNAEVENFKKINWEDNFISLQTTTKQKLRNTHSSPATSGIKNIGAQLSIRQDEYMRIPFDGTYLISWPAWSWKTNLILHRIDYAIKNNLLKEGEIAVFCFNKWLKQYIETAFKQIISDPWIQFHSIDQFLINFINSYAFTSHDKIIINYEKEINIPNSVDEIEILLQHINPFNMVCIFNENFTKILFRYICLSYSFKEIKNQTLFFILFYWASTINKIIIFDNWIIKFQTHILIKIINSCYKLKITDMNIVEGRTIMPILYTLMITLLKNLFPTYCTQYKYWFVDEFQDLNFFQLLSIQISCQNNLTIVGDINQSIFSNPNNNLASKMNIIQQYELNVSHRWTVKTLIFANYLLEKPEENTKLYASNYWENPLIHFNKNISSILIDYIKKGMKKYPEANFLITLPTKKECEKIKSFLWDHKIEAFMVKDGTWDFNKKLFLAPYQSIKWLEFDFVFILWINSLISSNIQNKNQLLYTVATRPRRRLIILEEINSRFREKLNKIPKTTYDLF